MSNKISSRERMMAAIECRESDHVPLCFMIFSTLRNKSKDPFDFVDKQLELGLDAVIDIPLTPPVDSDLRGLPVEFGPKIQIRERREERGNVLGPLLHKDYITPSGTLTTTVEKAEDWPYENRVPLLNDYLIPRSERFLITKSDDLSSLKYLLKSPTKPDIDKFRAETNRAKEFAQSRGVMVSAGWGVGMDAACWLVGIEELMLASIYEPEFVDELAQLIAKWNQERMQIMLDVGVDLFVRRGWYESTDFWPPDLYRQFILPSLQEEVKMAHAADAKFGYILTTGTMPLLDILVESGIDVLIGVDPVQGRDTDLAEIKRKLNGKISIWGGVNGFVTVEMGTKEEIENAVETAIHTLAPGGGLILSPVDNIRDTSEGVWKNVLIMIDAWKSMRDAI